MADLDPANEEIGVVNPVGPLDSSLEQTEDGIVADGELDEDGMVPIKHLPDIGVDNEYSFSHDDDDDDDDDLEERRRGSRNPPQQQQQPAPPRHTSPDIVSASRVEVTASTPQSCSLCRSCLSSFAKGLRCTSCLVYFYENIEII